MLAASTQEVIMARILVVGPPGEPGDQDLDA
jgi:hypothetical protein